MIIDDITVSAQRFPGLTEKRFRERPSTIYNLYQDLYGISVVRSSERLRAVAADAEIASLLGIAPGAPLLQIRRIALAYNDLPVEFRISHVNTAGYEYFSDLGRS
jgi:GntR family transcriptional regulator